MALSERLTRAQEILGHEFNNKVLLRAALTHPSAVEGLPVSASYERLEFLGDSIWVAWWPVRSLSPIPSSMRQAHAPKGVPCLGRTLSEVSHELGIDDIIIFGASETGTGARGLHSALENAMSRSWVRCTWMPAGMRRRSSSTVRLSRTWPPSVPSTPRTPSRSCRSACRQTATSLPRISWSAPRAPHMRPPLPLWCSSTVFARPRHRFLQEGAEGAAALEALDRMGYTTNGVILNKKPV